MIDPFNRHVSVALMTDDLLPSVVALEESCGLNSRGLEGYRKLLSNPKAVLLVALPALNPVIPIDPISPIGALSGDVVLDELQIDNLAVSERWPNRRSMHRGRGLFAVSTRRAATCTTAENLLTIIVLE